MTFALGYSRPPRSGVVSFGRDLSQLRSKCRRVDRSYGTPYADDTLTKSVRLRKFRLSAYIRARFQRKELDLRRALD